MFTSKNQPGDAKASLSKHVTEQTGHAIDTADYSGHGHSVGAQGGHPMPPSDADKQGDSHIPQKMYQDKSDTAGTKNPTGNKFPFDNKSTDGQHSGSQPGVSPGTNSQ